VTATLPAAATRAAAPTAADERRTVATRVGRLAVRTRGDGPTAVLWHSLFVDDRSWGRVEDDLARDRRLVIITGPGHGSSGDPGHGYDLDDCAAAAAEVLASLGAPPRVDWVGNAWGGHVGTVFAAACPERCRSLVTLGSPVQALSRSERRTTGFLLVLYRLLGATGFIRNGVRDVLLSRRTRAEDAHAVELVTDCLRSANRRPLANAITSISLRRPDLTSRLAAIRCPALFVTGSDHAGWTPDQAQAASRLLSDGSVAVVGDAAYLIPLEAPADTVRLIRELWARGEG
jgi:pimeloyl-ACP methyl ester carboxylesterase